MLTSPVPVDNMLVQNGTIASYQKYFLFNI